MSDKPNVVLFTDFTDPLFLHKPLGAFKVAAELRSAGFSVQVISHLHIFSVDEIKKILEHTIGPNTLFVGFSSFFYKQSESPTQLINTLEHEEGGIKYEIMAPGSLLPHGHKYNAEIRALIKQLNPACKLVLGGPDAKDAGHVSIYDYVILGYADVAVVELARHLAHKDPLQGRRSVFGPVIIDGGKAEAYDFVGTKMRFDDSDIILPGETLTTEISRGCIFRCKFCSFPLNGKKKNDFIKLEDILVEEFLENYERFGVTRYLLSDDTFNDSREKIEMMHRVAQRLPFQLEYWAYIRLDLMAAHPDTIDLLYESGLRACYFGIETMNEKTASMIGKGGNRQKLTETIKLLKRKFGENIMLNGSFIFGLPGESLDSMRETAEQLINKELELDSWHVRALWLRPGVWQQTLYTSELDLNYSKYGYRVLEEKNDYLYWANEHTTYEECIELSTDTLRRGIQAEKRKISGLDSFYIAGLGLGLEHSQNHYIHQFDWHNVDLTKQARAEEYKRRLFSHLDIH